MSTVTNGATGSLRDISKADTAVSRLGQQLITGKRVQNPEDGPSTWLQAGRAQSAAGLLDAIHTGLNELATNIRVADTTMQSIGSMLGIMRGQLEEAQKHPVGDPMRQQLIAGANTARQQIDDLVYTTSQSGARNLMSDTAKNSDAGPIQAMVGINGEVKTVHAQQVDTGAGGLDIPILTVKATDDQLQIQLESVQTAKATLEARRNGLAADASSIIRYSDQSLSIARFFQREAESLTGADETEAALAIQSVSTQRSLAVQSLASMNTSRDAILELLR